MIDALLGNIVPWLISAVVFLGVMIAAHFNGRSKANAKNAADLARDELETTKRMRDANPIDDDADSARDRLRERQR